MSNDNPSLLWFVPAVVMAAVGIWAAFDWHNRHTYGVLAQIPAVMAMVIRRFIYGR